MRGDEARVVSAFTAWLEAAGWTVSTEVDFCDVVAVRGDEQLFAEAKGRTAAQGLDVDTMYGQILRRMPSPMPPNTRFAVVVPESSRHHVLRVPEDIRRSLRIDVFVVSDDGAVEAVPSSAS